MNFEAFSMNGVPKSEPVMKEAKSTATTIDSIAKKRKDLDELIHKTLQIVIDQITITSGDSNTLQKKKVQDKVHESINSILFENKTNLSYRDREKVCSAVMYEIFGYGPITVLLDDPTVSEVMVNGPKRVFVERNGKIVKTEHTFRDDKHVMHIIDKIIAPLGRRVDESSPMVDARLPDGSRVNVVIPPLSVTGPSITIRKFAADSYGLKDLIASGTLDRDMAKFLRAAVKGKTNILVSGGTGSGKTTLLNILSSFIPNDERIVTIEDAAEIQLQQENLITLEARPANVEGKGKVSIRDLVVNALRMRPDRIIVGEVRNGEALDMLQAMNTGHDGSLTTIHANTPRDSLSRLETMVMMSGVDLPSKAIREQISSAIDLIVQIKRFPDGSRKIIQVSEILGMGDGTITLQDLYMFKHEGFTEKGEVVGKHVSTGLVSHFMEKLKESGENIPINFLDMQEPRFEPKGK